MTRGALVALGLLVGAACSLEPRTDLPAQGSAAGATDRQSVYREVLRPEGVARLPVFSSAIRNGDLLWMSGQIGTVPGADPPVLVEGGVEAETHQTLRNIDAVLAEADLDRGNLIKCSVFLADIADYAAVNEVYAGFFEGYDPPARSALAGSGLALGARVEIECIAAFPPGR